MINKLISIVMDDYKDKIIQIEKFTDKRWGKKDAEE